MALTRNQLIVSSVFLVIALGSVATLFYRATTVNLEQRQQENQRRADAVQPLRKTAVMGDRVVLIRGEGTTLGRTRVVYQGWADDHIHIDLYLLDLDPSYPYPRAITKEQALKGIQLGSQRYRLHSVNRNTLILLFAD